MKAEVYMAQEDSGSGLLWFVTGIVVGAATALLLAPEAGERTRKRLLKHAKRGSAAISESGQNVYQRGKDIYDRGREIAEDAAEMFERGRKLAEKRIDEVL
jgi:gas vesicle protein